MNYPGGPSVITRVLKGEKGDKRVRVREDGMMEAEVE